VNQAYALIIQDERQKLVAGSSRLMPENMTHISMFTSRSDNYAPNGFCDFCHMEGHMRADCHKLMKCDFCHKTGYLKVDCFRLIGYPPCKCKKEDVVVGNSIYDAGSMKAQPTAPNQIP